MTFVFALRTLNQIVYRNCLSEIKMLLLYLLTWERGRAQLLFCLLKDKPIRLSAVARRGIVFDFYFDCGCPLLCLNEMQQDMLKHQPDFKAIFSVFLGWIYVFWVLLTALSHGRCRKRVHIWFKKKNNFQPPVLHCRAAAGPVDLSFTHLRAASRLQGERSVCVSLRQIRIYTMTRDWLTARNSRRMFSNGHMKEWM